MIEDLSVTILESKFFIFAILTALSYFVWRDIINDPGTEKKWVWTLGIIVSSLWGLTMLLGLFLILLG